MQFAPLYAALVQARLARPGLMFPVPHYSAMTYLRAGGPMFTLQLRTLPR
jgi:hypothetical protein